MKQWFISLLNGFRYAFCGLWTAIRHERNFRIHIIAVCYVTWLGVLYGLTATQWCLLILLFATVLALELLNSALESTVDMITAEQHPLAKRAKDLAAAAVLVAALGAVVFAVFLFSDPTKWAQVFSKILSFPRLPILIVSILPAFLFIRFGGRSK